MLTPLAVFVRLELFQTEIFFLVITKHLTLGLSVLFVCRKNCKEAFLKHEVFLFYLEKVEGAGDAELDLLSVHSWRIIAVKLHQVLGLINRAHLHEALQGLNPL